jgi:DNA-binding FadR family transcriptional regulator
LTLSTRSRDGKGLKQLTAIHDAILSRDPNAARQAVEAHITAAATAAQGFLKDAKAGSGKDLQL